MSRPEVRGLRRWKRAILAVEALEDRVVLTADAGVGALFTDLQVNPTSYTPDRILVQFQPDANLNSLPAGTQLAGQLPLVENLYEVLLDPGFSVEEARAAFAADPRVLVAEPNYIVTVAQTPNDPAYNQTWGMHNTGQTGGTSDADIDAPAAWDTEIGTGTFVVAVIDTGVDFNHPDLAANMWKNTAELAGTAGVDDDGNGYIDDINGWNFATDNNNPMDTNGHGTHVAGTIGAVGNNGIGVAGVAWNVKIMPLKFLNPSGTIADAIDALNYAVANGAKISNNSWGGGGYSSLMQTAISNARSAGHIFVAAAGNNGSNNDVSPFWPANYAVDNVVTVASTDHNDVRSSFSNYGVNTVEIAAPGTNIYSTWPTALIASGYNTISGTSMATPHVSGAMALLWDHNPTWTYNQVISTILNNADVLPSLNGLVAGSRRLNIDKAINFTPPPDLTAPRVVSAAWSNLATSTLSSLRLTFSEAILPSSFTNTPADVTFTGPGGLLSILGVAPVTGTGNTQFDITFAPQTALGNYTMVIGPDVTDASGNALNQDGDGNFGETNGEDQYVALAKLGGTSTVSGGPVDIRDKTTVTSTLVVANDFYATDVNVQLDITHTYDNDLKIVLVSPWGTAVTLSNRRGGSGDHFTNTLFDDEAAKSIALGKAPFLGSFKAESALSVFDKRNLKGTWKLQISDLTAKDTGKLWSWSLILNGSGAAGAVAGLADEPIPVFEDFPVEIVDKPDDGPTTPPGDSPPTLPGNPPENAPVPTPGLDRVVIGVIPPTSPPPSSGTSDDAAARDAAIWAEVLKNREARKRRRELRVRRAARARARRLALIHDGLHADLHGPAAG